MKFTMSRDRTVNSVLGHTIFFPKGVPTYVPPEMHREVLALGADCEELDASEELAEPTPPEAPEAPSDPTERKKALFEAFDRMVLRNRRGDFTAGGQPHIKVLSKELGWPVGDKERDLEWVEFLTKGKDE